MIVAISGVYSYQNQKAGDEDEAPIQILDGERGRLIDSTGTLEPAQAKLTVNKKDPFLLPQYPPLPHLVALLSFSEVCAFPYPKGPNLKTADDPSASTISHPRSSLLRGLKWMDVE